MEGEERREESAPQKSSGGGAKYIWIILVIIVLAIAGFYYKSNSSSKSQSQQQTAMAPAKKVSVQPTKAAMMAKSMYKDGTYTAEGDYVTHVGQKKISVTVTLKNDMITSADVKNEADDPMSTKYQDSFISGYKPMVIGKDISTVHVGKVALSSLTPNGFNNALKSIEQQAKS